MTKTSRELKTYLFTYQCDGAEYALRVPAESQQAALARVRRMSTAIFDGEVIAKIPMSLGWSARALTALRNAVHLRHDH
jgi:hypothetical protein